MEIRNIEQTEMKEALKLVWKTFLEYEAPDYTEQGIAEFKSIEVNINQNPHQEL